MNRMAALPTGPRKEFLLLYYQYVTAKNAKTLEYRTSFIKLSLIGTFGFYAALSSSNLGLINSPFRNILFHLPLAFNLMGFALDSGLQSVLNRRSSVMSLIEEEFDFQHWKNVDQKPIPQLARQPFSVIGTTFWLGMVFICGAVSLVTYSSFQGMN